ncbi:MAG: VWA domain-containing protein [Synergistaceae bacterium]|nr:VWA domain-containing protein [Synergistaceae bacterium]
MPPPPSVESTDLTPEVPPLESQDPVPEIPDVPAPVTPVSPDIPSPITPITPNSQDIPDPVIPVPSGYVRVTFDTDGGSLVSSQTILAGSRASEPETPERDNDYFMGWYPQRDFSFAYDFTVSVDENMTLYAKWYNVSDDVDSDGDGLTDSLEETLGSDPFSADTDDDGLSDYEELGWLNYNPLLEDTDGNGILDRDEDPDGDGLTNLQESNIGTNMVIKDTDHDGLNDYDEAMTYHTDPLKPDTDGDGVDDATEIAIGSDPLKAETSFSTTLASSRVASGDETAIDISVTMHSGAEGAGTLSVSMADRSDSRLVSSYIPGYLAAYALSADSEFSSATVTFTIGSEVGTVSDIFRPAIYYLNEETGLLEELENQRIDGNRIIAEVSHFSIYVLLNKIKFDEVWSNDIKPPFFEGGDDDGVLEVVFVIDGSGSMDDNDPDRLALKLSSAFVSKLRSNKDRAAVVRFTSSAYVLQELTADKDLLNTAINSIRYSGGTNILRGLNIAAELLLASENEHQYIILLTDGDDGISYSRYSSVIQNAVDKGIVVYTIGMGDAVENVLRSIADDTGGKYYAASASSTTEDIMNLDEVFEEIEAETVDLTVDANNDGIPDYYAQLLNDGDLRVSDGTTWLVGVLDMYGDSDDWDNDGLKNGEEVEIRHDGWKTYAYMKSDPLLYDSDFDGCSDYEEVKNMKTSPMKITMPPSAGTAGRNFAGASFRAAEDISASLADIMDDNYFSGWTEEYISLSSGGHWMQYVFEPLPWKRVKLVKNALINYFSEYTTTEALSRDSGVVSRLHSVKAAIDSINLAKDCIAFGRKIVKFTADIGSGQYTAASLDKNAADRIKKAGQAAVSMDKVLKTALSVDIKAINDFAKKAAETYVSLDIAGKKDGIQSVLSDAKDCIEMINSASSDISRIKTIPGALDMAVKAADKTYGALFSLVDCARKFRRVEIPFKCGWAEGLTNYLDTEAGTLGKKNIKNGQVIGMMFTVLFDAADTAVNTLEVVETYGKIETNYAEYQKYLDILRYIAGNESLPDYLRDGAEDIAGMFSAGGDPVWEEFDSRVRKAAAGEIAAGAFKMVLDVGMGLLSIEFPILSLTNTVVSAAGSIVGLNARAKTIIESEAYYRITEGSVRSLRPMLSFRGNVFEFKSEHNEAVIKYAVQVCQSRIVGLKRVLDYLLDGGIAGFFDRGGVTKELKESMYKSRIQQVYDAAKNCMLKLSDALPYYSEYGR